MADQLMDILMQGSGADEDGPSTLSEADGQALEFVLNASGDFRNELEEQEKKRVEAERVEKERKKVEASLETNQFLLSTVTGGVLPKSKIDRVFTVYADDHFPEDVRCDIPKIDPMYHWDPDLLEALWLGYYLNVKVLAVGPPGTGKTTASNQFAALVKQPFARFNGKDGIEASAFLGYPWATKEGMEWKDGLMPQCLKQGYLVVIDEIMKLPPGIQMAMQSLYEQDGFLMLDDKPGTIKDKHVYPTETFRLFATDNTKGTGDGLGSYAAGQFQDVSTLDRFDITVNVDYLDRKVEEAMLMVRFPNAHEPSVRKVVALANLVREAFKQGNLALTLSPRGLINICKLMDNGMSLETATKLSFVNKLGDDREVEVAQKFIGDCI